MTLRLEDADGRELAKIQERVARIRCVPDGRVCTTVWTALPGPGVTVLAEYDAALGYLCLATFEAVVPAC